MKMVHGRDDFHLGTPGGGNGIGQFLEGAQFHIDQSRMRQKTGKKLAPLRKTEVIQTAFCRMADGDQQWDTQFGQSGKERCGVCSKIIDADFKEIDIPRPDFQGRAKCPGGMDRRHNLWRLT